MNTRRMIYWFTPPITVLNTPLQHLVLTTLTFSITLSASIPTRAVHKQPLFFGILSRLTRTQRVRKTQQSRGAGRSRGNPSFYLVLLQETMRGKKETCATYFMTSVVSFDLFRDTVIPCGVADGNPDTETAFAAKLQSHVDASHPQQTPHWWWSGSDHASYLNQALTSLVYASVFKVCL